MYLNIFNQVSHYHLSEDIKILCMYYQKRSGQYAEEKNTFLRYEDLRVSWDLKSAVIKTSITKTRSWKL